LAIVSPVHIEKNGGIKNSSQDLVGKKYARINIPTPRILVSLIENFQQPDGSIKIPEALQPYFGKDKISLPLK
jgi:hypothetical protein